MLAFWTLLPVDDNISLPQARLMCQHGFNHYKVISPKQRERWCNSILRYDSAIRAIHKYHKKKLRRNTEALLEWDREIEVFFMGEMFGTDFSIALVWNMPLSIWEIAYTVIRDKHEPLKQWFVSVCPLATRVFGDSQPLLLWQASTQRQYPGEAGQGSQATASEWVPTDRGRAGKL